MEVTSAIVCSHAEPVVIPGRADVLNLYGVMTSWTCAEFPVSDVLVVVLFWQAAPEDIGRRMVLHVKLIDEDGQAVVVGAKSVEPEASGERGIPAAGYVFCPGIVKVQRPGNHEFAVFVGTEHKLSIPFRVYGLDRNSPVSLGSSDHRLTGGQKRQNRAPWESFRLMRHMSPSWATSYTSCRIWSGVFLETSPIFKACLEN